jgi:hypothetical protein
MNNETLDIELGLINFKFKVFKNETLSNIVRSTGTHITKDIDLYKEFIKEGSYFIDAGANIGWFTLIGSSLVGETGKVFAIEPEPGNLSLLNENIELNNINNVTVKDIALSNEDGYIMFYTNPENFGDHSVSPNTWKRCFKPNKSLSQEIEVKSSTLDSLFTDEEFSKVSFIKLDIQGSEPRVLQSKHLKKYRPNITLEYSPDHIYEAGGSPFEIFSFIDNNKYKIYELVTTEASVSRIPIFLPELFQRTQSSLGTYTGIDLLLVPIIN